MIVVVLQGPKVLKPKKRNSPLKVAPPMLWFFVRSVSIGVLLFYILILYELGWTLWRFKSALYWCF